MRAYVVITARPGKVDVNGLRLHYSGNLPGGRFIALRLSGEGV